MILPCELPARFSLLLPVLPFRILLVHRLSPCFLLQSLPFDLLPSSLELKPANKADYLLILVIADAPTIEDNS